MFYAYALPHFSFLPYNKDAMKPKAKPVIILMGPQGSGKGTQAEILKSAYGFAHIEVGELLRQAAQKHNHFATVVRESMQKGKLVPTRYAQEVLLQAIEKYQHRPLIIDGAPRQLVEARALETTLKNFGRSVSLVIDISLSRPESIRRLLLRKRADDTPEAIAQRLQWSRQKIEMVLWYYSRTKKYPVEIINGERPIATVNRSIVKILRHYHLI
jgi:adenylate kinase